MGQGSQVAEEGNSCKVTVWTGQGSLVADALHRTGRYVVKSRYVDLKYQETAWIFQEAYRFLMEQSRHYMERPEGAESPIWVYTDPTNIFKDSGTHLWKLAVPKEKLLLFDVRKWNRILNLSYISDSSEEQEAFDGWLRKRGVRDPLDIFSTPHYPIEKREIRKSWMKLFQDERPEPHYEQGMIWEIRKEWIAVE